jgi:hypothetical protein
VYAAGDIAACSTGFDDGEARDSVQRLGAYHYTGLASNAIEQFRRSQDRNKVRGVQSLVSYGSSIYYPLAERMALSFHFIF